ncbi:MAG: iron-containing alcohol dehydrogenase [Alphaproteobacteria bacterium]|nr:iron-containing alcohol dehydrogenase [Alphaproteobacteria bacterium]
MSQPLKANWNYPTAIKFGAGRIVELPDHCRALGMKRPLVVTDSGLVKLPVVSTVVEILRDGGLVAGLFSDLRPNPVGRDVTAGVAAYRSGGHDGIIALGGGSALDVAKAIALMVGQTRPLWDFEDVGDNWLRVETAGMAPTLAIPTTAGTGSEVGRASVIIDEAAHRKVIIFHPRMLPGLVLADPGLTVGLPPFLTAATGIDAFVHSLEAFCSPYYHPLAAGIALQGMRLVHDYLPAAFRDGGDMTARSQMLAASLMGATAFQKGLGGVHALAHPIGAVYDTHHGLTNAVLVPYVLKRNRAAVEDRLGEAAGYLGLAQPSFDGFMKWLVDLRQELKIPHSLGELKLDDSRAEEIATMAKNDPSDGTNPLELSIADYRQIFTDAVAGSL